MIVSMFKIPVSEGREEEFAESFRQRKGLIDQMHGFVSLQVLKPQEGNLHVVMSQWQTKADFQAWTQSDEFAQAHRKRRPGLASGPPILEFFEVITSSVSA